MSLPEYQEDYVTKERHEINTLKKNLKVLQELTKSTVTQIERKKAYIIEILQGQGTFA